MQRTTLVLVFSFLAAACSSTALIDPDSIADDLVYFDPIFRARGNEPGWMLELGEERFALVTDYGQRRIDGSAPAARAILGGSEYLLTNIDLRVRVFDQICEDDATGMPHPHRVELDWEGNLLRGCGGEPVSLLLGNEWVVEEIQGAVVIEGARVSLRFDEDGRAGGRASCNSYGAGYNLTGEGLSFTQAVSTRMACMPEALMAQEQSYLNALEQVRRFSIDNSGALHLFGDEGRLISARRN